MNVTLHGADPRSGHHSTSGDKVAFTFRHRGQAAVRMRVSYDFDKPAIVHPLPGGGQPKARALPPGHYLVMVEVDAADLPGLPAKTIDSDVFVNGVLVLRAQGVIPPGQAVLRDGVVFHLDVA